MRSSASPAVKEQPAALRTMLLRQQAVAALRSTHLGDVARDFSFSHDGKRLFFVCNGDLFCSELGQQQEEGQLEWKSALDATNLATGKLSREEVLLRERMRVGGSGVSSYAQHASGSRLLVAIAGSLFSLDVEAGSLKELKAAQEGARLHHALSQDGRALGFVRKRTLYLSSVERGGEIAVGSPANEHSRCGEADFNHQEEFDRYDAFWINPVAVEDEVYQVFFIESDESDVHVYNIVEPGITGEVDAFKYPLTGTRNSTLRLWLATVNLKENTVERVALPALTELWPDAEYVPRAGWSPDGSWCWLQVLDRSQENSRLFKVDAASATIEGKPVFGLHNKYWINSTREVGRPLHFFRDGSILLSTEDTGYAHLYVWKEGEMRAVTQGDWPVIVGYRNTASTIVVDEARQVVFFEALRETPLEKHLYVASLLPTADPTNIFRLTESGYDHQTTLSRDGLLMIDYYSSLSSSPQAQIYRIELAGGDRFRAPVLQPLGRFEAIRNPQPTTFPARPPTPFVIKDPSGRDMHGLYYLPVGWSKGDGPLPTLIYTYGGPHVQLCRNNYEWTRGGRAYQWQLLAAMGYAVSIMDNRGSFNRGIEFEGEIKHAMGTVEIDDQAAHVQYLVKEGISDAQRVAVTGRSYGGYMTLMCLCKRPDVFKIGYSFAPVTLWEAYDTGYTERYMGLPENNAEGYRTANVITFVDGFPDEPHRLVIGHGILDENVHFSHTTKLVEALIAKLKPYELQVFPTDRHGISLPMSRLHSLCHFLQHITTHL